MAGQPVTVWSETRSPRQQWMTYYTSYLNSIGFKATQKVIADATYFTTIGESKTLHPQTGFADWNQDFPNPVDFYGVLLDGKAILPTDTRELRPDERPVRQRPGNKLGATPTTQLRLGGEPVAGAGQYVAKRPTSGLRVQEFPGVSRLTGSTTAAWCSSHLWLGFHVVRIEVVAAVGRGD